MVEHTPIPNQTCYACGAEQTLATPGNTLEAVTPHSGDMNMCLKCGVLGVFGDDMIIRPATPEDLEGFTPEFLLKIIATQERLRRRFTSILSPD